MLRRSQPEFRDVVTNFPEMTKLLQNRLHLKTGSARTARPLCSVICEARQHLCISRSSLSATSRQEKPNAQMGLVPHQTFFVLRCHADEGSEVEALRRRLSRLPKS